MFSRLFFGNHWGKYSPFDIKNGSSSPCGTVKREPLDFLSDNPFHMKRLSCCVGRRCRASSIEDIAEELRSDCHAGKELEKQYRSGWRIASR